MSAHDPQLFEALEIRVRGRVQGVGFRPKIWHIARELGLAGEVLNDSDGVLLRVGGDRARLAAFLDGIESDLPPLARVDSIETRSYSGQLSSEFRIAESSSSRARTQIAPDAAICAACSGRIARPQRPPLSLSLHELHALRTATEHCHRDSVRSRDDHDGAVRAVSGLP